MFQVRLLRHKRLLNLLLRFMPLKYRGVYIAQGTKIFADAEVGFGTRVNGPAVIKGYGLVRIGKYCAIGDNLRLITSNHNLKQLVLQNMLQQKIAGGSAADEKCDITLGHDVWVGDNVIILPGVSIGNGAVIGAGSIVTRSVLPYNIVAGNPARKIGGRFSSRVIELLQHLQWWEWSFDRMKSAEKLFTPDFASLSEDEMIWRIQSEIERSEP